jgi:hypothetical protein
MANGVTFIAAFLARSGRRGLVAGLAVFVVVLVVDLAAAGADLDF